MKRGTRTIVILSLALASCRTPSYAPTATPETVSLRMLATTTTYPLLRELAAEYDQPGLRLAVQGTAAGWDNIAAHLAAGDSTYALTAYVPPDAALWVAPIGQNGITVIVHLTNTVPSLTLRDLRLIFQGRIANWAEVGGPDLPVVVVSREDMADTRLAFDALVMAGRTPTLAARLALSDGSVVDQVAATPGAIGYISLSHLDSRVRAVPLATEAGATPVSPSPESIRANVYPLRTPVYVVGMQPPPPDSTYWNWFAWMQSDAGQQIVARYYSPLR